MNSEPTPPVPFSAPGARRRVRRPLSSLLAVAGLGTACVNAPTVYYGEDDGVEAGGGSAAASGGKSPGGTASGGAAGALTDGGNGLGGRTPAAGGALGATGGVSTGGGPSSGGAVVASGGRVGIECEPGSFHAEDSTSDTCEPWSNCEPGSFVAEEPTSERDRLCEPCPLGSFSQEENAGRCAPSGACSFDETASEPATATTDIVCEAAQQTGWFSDGLAAEVGGLATSGNSIFGVGNRSDKAKPYESYGMIAEFDSDGELVAERTIPLLYSFAYDVVVAPDGAPVVVGETLTDENGVLNDSTPHAFVGWGADPTVDGWAVHLGVDVMSSARGVALGPDGTVWVAGALYIRSENSLDFHAIVARYSADHSLIWTKVIDQGTAVNSLAVDAQGNAFILGAGSPGSFLAKVDPNGDVIWRIDDEDACLGCDKVAVDSQGRVTVLGVSSFETFPRPAIARQFDGSSGKELWTADLGSEVWYSDLAVAADGSVFVSGATDEAAVIGVAVGAVVVKIASSGEVLWLQRLGTGHTQEATAIAVDPLSRVWLAGDGPLDDDTNPSFLIRVGP